VFLIQNASPGFSLFSYPFSGHWSATINRNYTDIYRANGVAQAIYLSGRGKNIVEFRYWSSAAFWGMIVSCATFILSGFFISLYYVKKPLSYLIIAVILVITVSGMIFWYKSLYKGDNLFHRYAWSSNTAHAQANLAYGKTTYMSSVFLGGSSSFV